MHVSRAVVSPFHFRPFSEQHPRECRILLAVARVHDLLNDVENATTYYKKASSSISRRRPYGDTRSVLIAKKNTESAIIAFSLWNV